jgi:transposase
MKRSFRRNVVVRQTVVRQTVVRQTVVRRSDVVPKKQNQTFRRKFCTAKKVIKRRRKKRDKQTRNVL